MRKYIKKIVPLVIIFTIGININNTLTVKADELPVYAYDYKSVSESKTSSSNNFDSYLNYSDLDGFNGYMNKNGSAYVISGQAPQSYQVVKDKVSVSGACTHEVWSVWNGTSWGPLTSSLTYDSSYYSYKSMGYKDESGTNNTEYWTQEPTPKDPTVGTSYMSYYAIYKATMVLYESKNTPDTRMWKQDYSGTVSREYLNYVLDAEISTDMPTEMVKGDTYNFTVTAKNLGTNTWKDTSNVELTKRGTFPMDNIFKLPKGIEVRPNESYTWKVSSIGPDIGTYTAIYQMQQRGKGYFGNIINKDIIVTDFGVKSEIKRILSPHEAKFKEGEKGILKIKLSGDVDKVKIIFPYELTILDNTLNAEKVVETNNADIDYEFFIPIGTPNKSYNVEVIAYRKGKEKNSYANFLVTGNILDNIRTRIRIR